jgi:hypothetical protein
MRSLYSFCLIFFVFSVGIHSQDSTRVKNTKHETITRVVTVRDTAVSKTVTERHIEEKQVIRIQDTGEENQNIDFSNDTNETVRVTDEVKADKTNKELIQEIKEAQIREIEESKKEQLLKAQEEKKVIDQRKEVIEMKRMQRKKDSLNRIKNDQS